MQPSALEGSRATRCDNISKVSRTRRDLPMTLQRMIIGLPTLVEQGRSGLRRLFQATQHGRSSRSIERKSRSCLGVLHTEPITYLLPRRKIQLVHFNSERHLKAWSR